MAFGANPTNESPTWTTIHADRVRSVRYQRGRLNELNRMETGTAAALLGDPDSWFDPDNTASPYSPNVRPYVPARIFATLAGVDYPMFRGYVERWPRSVRIADFYTQREVELVDGLEWLAHAGLQGDTEVAELAGTRVTNTLDR